MNTPQETSKEFEKISSPYTRITHRDCVEAILKFSNLESSSHYPHARLQDIHPLQKCSLISYVNTSSTIAFMVSLNNKNG